MKNYHEQAYPTSILVRVTWPDGSCHVDSIKGLNAGHAMCQARWNWHGALLVVKMGKES